VPHSASAFGHATAPYGAQGPADVWNFNFSGFFAAGVRAAIRQRPLPPGSERDSTALRNAVQTGEPFSAGGTQGSWVQMTFEYGNRIATAHVNLTTWNPSRGASFTQLSSSRSRRGVCRNEKYRRIKGTECPDIGIARGFRIALHLL
jgi:hypothetical protein